jgi:hypothetical protein
VKVDPFSQEKNNDREWKKFICDPTYSDVTMGYPAFFQASMPPRRAFAFLNPMSMYLVASRAALASLVQAQ